MIDGEKDCTEISMNCYENSCLKNFFMIFKIFMYKQIVKI